MGFVERVVKFPNVFPEDEAGPWGAYDVVSGCGHTVVAVLPVTYVERAYWVFDVAEKDRPDITIDQCTACAAKSRQSLN